MEPSERDLLTTLYQARVAEHDASAPGYAEAWAALVEHVLVHGGELVVPPLEIDLAFVRFLVRRRVDVMTGSVVRRAGRPNHCHDNVIDLWYAGVLAAIGTGFALSPDELWRPHSWGLLADGTIIETTEPRISYVGVRLEGAAAEFFCEN